MDGVNRVTGFDLHKQAFIDKQAAQIKELEGKIEELKNLLVDKAKSKESKPPKEENVCCVTIGRLVTAPETNRGSHWGSAALRR